jgi:Fe-S-cluster containining protein
MEIDIDTKIFKQIAKAEYEISSAEIKRNGPLVTCGSYHRRLDDSATNILAESDETPDCSNGCWYCCYYKVDLRAEEAFRIINFVREHFSKENLVELRKEITEKAKIMKSLTQHEQLAINMKCPFLENNSCSIYEVRPEKCRTFHAKDVEGCKQSYDEPTNLEIPSSYITSIFTSNEAHSEGYMTAMTEQGYDVSPYELNTVLNVAMVDAKYRKRFIQKKRAFPQSLCRE